VEVPCCDIVAASAGSEIPDEALRPGKK